MDRVELSEQDVRDVIRERGFKADALFEEQDLLAAAPVADAIKRATEEGWRQQRVFAACVAGSAVLEGKPEAYRVYMNEKLTVDLAKLEGEAAQTAVDEAIKAELAKLETLGVTLGNSPDFADRSANNPLLAGTASTFSDRLRSNPLMH